MYKNRTENKHFALDVFPANDFLNNFDSLLKGRQQLHESTQLVQLCIL